MGYKKGIADNLESSSDDDFVYPQSISTDYELTVNVSTLPTEVDWVKKGWVNPVQDQGNCGSCYAFASCGALEGQIFNATQSSAILSEQAIVDCPLSNGNRGCNGGLPTMVFEQIMANKGLPSDEAYPYISQFLPRERFNIFYQLLVFMGACRRRQWGKVIMWEGLQKRKHNKLQECKDSQVPKIVQLTGYRSVVAKDELALQQAVALVGPIVVAIHSNSSSFLNYGDGIYSSKECMNRRPDHAVLVVGYGVQDGKEYWLIKNSWSTKWGINGYVKIARNMNMCGVAGEGTFPTGLFAEIRQLPRRLVSGYSTIYADPLTFLLLLIAFL